MNKYYVYFHINPVKNEVFYVGMGYGRRANDKSSRSNHWKNIVNKYNYIINIVDKNITQEEAFEKEKFYIKFIGRKDLGLGPLVNMTNGGEGSKGRTPWNKGLKTGFNEAQSKAITGKKQSEETKLKRSISLVGKLKGRVFSKETLQKMSESASLRKQNERDQMGKFIKKNNK